MLDKIESILKNQCELHPGDTLLIGLSGGADSLCLLHVLHLLGYSLVAMHVNHKLRPESDDEVMAVKQYVDNIGVELVTATAQVMDYANKQSISVEEAARQLRYRLLFQQAKSCGAKAVVVGHNADDQVETILFHFIRGTGLSGLRGMEFRTLPNPWSDEIALIRPFLSTRRTEIQKFLDERELHPVIDNSNFDTSYFRNRLRHELIPLLKSYGPSVDEGILRMGETLKDDYRLLQQLTDIAWDSCIIQEENEYLLFKTAEFIDLPISIQRYLLRHAISYFISGLKDVDFDCIERGRNCVLKSAPNSRVELLAGLRIIKEREQFWVAGWNADLPVCDYPTLGQNEIYALPVPSTLQLPHGWQLDARQYEGVFFDGVKNGSNDEPYLAWLDSRQVELPLNVRTRKPGDKITPIGMNGHSLKISDIMINQKIPARVRDTWPIVCSENEIVWMPGYRISSKACLKPDTRSAILLKLSQVFTA